MALTEIVFTAGEGQDFLLEIPTATYTGTLTDIVTYAIGNSDALCLELTKPTVIVDNRKKVR